MSYNRIDLATIASMQQSLQALQRRQTMPLSVELIGNGEFSRYSSTDSRLFFVWKEIIRQNGDFFTWLWADFTHERKRQLLKISVSGLYLINVNLSFQSNPPLETTIAVTDITKPWLPTTTATTQIAAQTFTNAATINATFIVYLYADDIIGVQFNTSSTSANSPIRTLGNSESPYLRIVALSQLYSTYVGDATVVRGFTVATISTITFTKLTFTDFANPFYPSYDNLGVKSQLDNPNTMFGSNALGGWDSLDSTDITLPESGTYFITATVVFDSTSTGATARWLVIRDRIDRVLAVKTVDAYVAAERAISVSCLVKINNPLTAVSASDKLHAAVYQNSGVNTNVIVSTSTANPSFFSLSAIYLGA